ncbi:hypothetical protein [Thiorhodovibrio frisius]|uniref:DUF8108 domain-containing protein n=1 Tax=Thiorhodovibrio frisius TaxID=631362 RepID=H8YY75_9GAMM|nr:hypothetical protein [Thiorhodovibrio frisius]EIC23401.1 hypothetical protein Thi970DRAFT_01065 [Thiorhodovibrio frisius]WPL23518.1 hypothetical protein Thiofri_03708 [Thiorhodovibrio frisius]
MKEMENLIDDYVTQGYEILEQSERNAMVRKKTWGSGGGHVLWAVLTVWWTIGIGNVIYALIAHYGAEKVMLKVDAEE